MQNLVYFPSFEPPNLTWLKFALLYIENFNPIVPNGATEYLSTDYQKVINETDLITPFNPQYYQGDRASIKAVEFLEKVLTQPYRYSSLFSSVNLQRTITNNSSHTFEILNEKFTSTWSDYCLHNGYGFSTDRGIQVSDTVAFIFMTFLAEEIAYDEGKSIITDNQEFDQFLSFRQAIPRTTIRKNTLAQGVLNLSLPRDISHISLDNLIVFRNRNRARIASFNHELNNSLNSIQEGIEDYEFVDRFNDIYSEITMEIIAQGNGIVNIPLSTYILFQDPTSTTPEYLSQFVGGLGILMNAHASLKKNWKDIMHQHNCRRYLTNLNRIR